MHAHWSLNVEITIRCFHCILDAVTSLAFYHVYVKLPDTDTPLHSYIANNLKFFPFFKDSLGALDGTHVAATHSLRIAHTTAIKKALFTKCSCSLHF